MGALNQGSLERRAVVARLLEGRKDLLVVTGLGSAAYDVMAAGDHDNNYYLWAAMGSAAMVGLGLANAQPNKQVLVVTGDGELLMGLGALATIAVQQPANLAIAVLDNGHYGETGMQVSHAGYGVDLHKVAAACGFASTVEITGMDGVDAFRASLAVQSGPRLATIRISAEEPPRVLPPRDGVHVKNRFRAALGFNPI
ncbi:MAG: thiamine pyrophosphate-dependent enzyme [Acetobacteraceae bacterium]|nr:thiamine pyrophosphate-dependent enzyme [Acetobacteraceae bacterium]